MAEGTPQTLGKQKGSVTGPYLSGKKAIPIPSNRRPALSLETKPSGASAEVPQDQKETVPENRTKPTVALARTLDVVGAQHNNLKDIEVKFPLETLTVVTGPSGCGKSSLVNDILFNALSRRLHRSTQTPGSPQGNSRARTYQQGDSR